MPLFVCDSCKCIENTNLGKYWRVERKLCSLCYCGYWHDKFYRETATKKIIKAIGENNFVYTADVEGVRAKNPCAR
jgi:hypothetical protein